ncbi:MAG: hypothetical protein E4H28_05525 [Gemmatimonadales bacterium]|nr:MAG: hypothetical protein E4H28_05525 [Gemmatimonadales bacterium]
MSEDVLRLDVFLHGARIERSVEVRRESHGIRYGERFVPWREVLWISRRSGMVLVFAEGVSLAVRATGKALGEFESWVDQGVDQTELRRRLMKQLGHEVVLFSAGTAVEGSLNGTAARGLYLAAATRRALYLFSGTNQHSMAWPVDQVKRQIARPGKAGGDSVLLRSGDDKILLRYLFPEEIVALATACRKSHPASRSTADRSLELFSRKEVSPPPQADLPEFSVAAGALHEVANRAAANVPGELQVRALLELGFFESHFLELGEIALGPLLLRKSAASTAGSLRRAAVAMDAAGLRDDTRAAVATAANRMLDVFRREAMRVAGIRGVDLEDREKRVPLVPDAMRDRLLGSMQAPFDRLWSRFEGLDGEGSLLIEALEEYEKGSPGEEDDRVGEAAEQWRATLSRLDNGYVGAWRELVEEIEKTWSTDLLPRLVQVATEDRTGVPEWVQLSVLGVVTLLLAVALVLVFMV